ncbi:hypothetical protein ACFSOZ_36785 [Mesorhizobium newzealandense]|uniref:Uncharacterized protein n=1 Tax=Mesorhizobium newzealandense TaxID=1300302 RepID=A0ABW4UPK2_9HYPH
MTTARSTVSRQKAKAGLVCLRTWHDEAHVSALLVGAGFLPAHLADDKEAIARALEAYIAAGEAALFDV